MVRHRRIKGYIQKEKLVESSVSESTAFGGFTEEQLKRYSRHIILRQVGGKGQRKLLKARVLIVGAGGLGSPSALYLAAAGVGTLGIVDFDCVDYSNLQRQILHCTANVGKPKVASAAETITALNPDVRVVQHQLQVNSSNAMELIDQYDLIVDGSDNFPTRYLLNDAAYLAGKPLVHGGILLFEGMATVFIPGKGCYRCLHPVPPPPGSIPSCQEAGVLGVLAGIIGCIQANEAIKLILDVGTPLVGRLIFFDALDMSFREVNFRRSPKCPLCGDNPTIKELIDYENFCGMPHRE
ncbi:MAG: molybdopterin-synthase adenylyltransferase MoeB [Chloroflexi bacterium]|nr:molybdopterin-synthase adenylyltransferase MoeB [Chloroflexota bacterium]